MRSITVHDLDDELDKRLTQQAKALGLSLNKTIKGLLADSLGIKRGNVDNSGDFKSFCGAWSKRDAAGFKKRIHDVECIDHGDWE